MQEIQQMLIQQYLYDIENLSNIWMYIPLCIPAFFYFVFMVCKWSVLTMPLWIPFSAAFQGIKIHCNKKDS